MMYSAVGEDSMNEEGLVERISNNATEQAQEIYERLRADGMQQPIVYSSFADYIDDLPIKIMNVSSVYCT